MFVCVCVSPDGAPRGDSPASTAAASEVRRRALEVRGDEASPHPGRRTQEDSM